ncbi:hypothetical protein DPMN_159133 [Dreissena polymorpha]|uniref:Uncharacterized protein n=1 Tax=Dreissena polymorpha TaxID=45954 RepID=A0A9D4EKH5_DREPO|nr:hypothetical protein DPMN_159133 [Dreissena polymorpha]
MGFFIVTFTVDIYSPKHRTGRLSFLLYCLRNSPACSASSFLFLQCFVEYGK